MPGIVGRVQGNKGEGVGKLMALAVAECMQRRMRSGKRMMLGQE